MDAGSDLGENSFPLLGLIVRWSLAMSKSITFHAFLLNEMDCIGLVFLYSCCFNPLAPNSSYTFEVRSNTSVGFTNFSTPQGFQTNEDGRYFVRHTYELTLMALS